MERATTFFGPAPWDPREGSKGQISFNFNYKVKIFIPNLCVFSQKKDKKHIGRDFYSVAWVTHQGWNFGRWVCPGGHFCKNGNVAYQIDGDDEQNRMHVKFSSWGETGDLVVR